jgi:MFS family permease
VILGIIALGSISTAGLFFRRDPTDMGQLPDGEEGEVPRGISRQNQIPQTEGLSIRTAIRTREFWMIAGLCCSFGFCRSTFLAHIAAHVQDLGFSLADGANVLAVLTGSSIIGRIGMGWVADIIGNRTSLIISFTTTTIILIWGLIIRELWGLYLFGLVFGFGWGAQAVLKFAVTSDVFGLISVGVVMGALGFAESCAAAFGSYSAGYVFDIVGNYQPAFLVGIAVSATGAILASFLKPSARRELG